MELSATVFLGIVLRIFAALDTAMVISLLRPGDERDQLILLKARHTRCLSQRARSFWM